MQGRWSLTAPLFENAPSAGPRLRAQAELMLERYGIVTRETVLAEGVPGGFASLYGEMSNLEMLGTARRGYFVEGLGGAQFALPGAVERLRSLPQRRRPLPGAGRHRPGESLRRRRAVAEARRRRPGGPAPEPDARAPTCCSATASRSCSSSAAAAASCAFAELEDEALAEAIGELARAAREGLLPRLAIERLDGEPVIGSGLEETLIAAGFSRQPRRLVASA